MEIIWDILQTFMYLNEDHVSCQTIEKVIWTQIFGIFNWTASGTIISFYTQFSSAYSDIAKLNDSTKKCKFKFS